MPKKSFKHDTDDRFYKAIEIILGHEGGYVNDPEDPGGETNWGISKRSYPELDIKNLTRDEAIEIYRKDWWDKYGYNRIENDSLAFMLFDQAILNGANMVNRMMQAVIRKDLGDLDIEVDGIIGDKTINAINNLNPQDLIERFIHRAERRYRDLDMPKYLKGWLNRLKSWRTYGQEK